MEMQESKSQYLLNEKFKNMICNFPDYKEKLNIENITCAVKWIYYGVESEDLPVATEIFRSSFIKIVKELLEDERIAAVCNCVGDLLIECYKKFIECMEIFWFGVDSIANVNSDIQNPLSKEMFEIIERDGEIVYPIFSKKCSNRKKKKTEETEIREIQTFNLKTPSQVLKFEYCRMKKTGYTLKKCANCGRYFFTKNKRTIFCENPSPQDINKNCKVIGPQIRRKKKIESDVEEKEFYSEYASLTVAAKRARDGGWDDKFFYEKRRKLLERHKQKNKKNE